MEGGFGVVTHELIELLIRLAFDTGADFAATILIQRRLMHDLPGDANCVAELLPVLLVRHVVKQNRRMLVRVAGFNPHMPTAWRAHRSDVALEAVLFHCVRAVIVNRHWQEMVLNIRPRKFLTAANKSACFKVVAGTNAGAAKQPLRTDFRLVPPLQGRVEGNRFFALILQIHLQVILKIFADAR